MEGEPETLKQCQLTTDNSQPTTHNRQPTTDNPHFLLFFALMDKRISRFLRRHHVLTLSSVSDAGAWTAHVFYAHMPDHDALVFTTDPKTRHGREMLENPLVSGGIVLETKVVGRIRGVQLTGMKEERVKNKEIDKDDEEERLKTRHSSLVTHHSSLITYLKRFPYAIAAKLDLWVLELDYVKMTDNRLGFGTKLEWRREE